MNNQNSLLIVGQSGAGKHLFATQRLVNSLAAGHAAVVFDIGHSYAGIGKALGGTLVSVTSPTDFSVVRFGTLPLTVIELEGVTEPFAVAALPGLPTLNAKTFVLVDEMWAINRTLPDLWEWLRSSLPLNFSFCGVLQAERDAEFSALPPGLPVQYIKNFASMSLVTDDIPRGGQ